MKLNLMHVVIVVAITHFIAVDLGAAAADRFIVAVIIAAAVFAVVGRFKTGAPTR